MEEPENSICEQWWSLWQFLLGTGVPEEAAAQTAATLALAAQIRDGISDIEGRLTDIETQLAAYVSEHTKGY